MAVPKEQRPACGGGQRWTGEGGIEVVVVVVAGSVDGSWYIKSDITKQLFCPVSCSFASPVKG